MPNTQAANVIVPGSPSYSDYWKEGLAVIPEYIAGFNWSCIYREAWKPTDDDLFMWELSDSKTYALVTGDASNVVGLDLDNVTDAEIEKVKKLLGDSPCSKVGSKGVTIFYKYNGEPNVNWIKDKIVKAELLSTGRRTTIPPTKHRSKNLYYRWSAQDLLTTCKSLPTLPANYRELLDSLFSIVRTPEKHYARVDYDNPPSYDEAVTALSFCDPSCSNQDWVNIGLSFKSEVGDAGYSDFDAWSSRGSNYDKRTIRSRWRSFNSRSITYGTLIHYAKQGGYKPPHIAERTPTKSVSPQDYTAKKLEYFAEQAKEANTLPEFYTNAPHHVKLICDWIVSTSLYPQPLITLGAVLSFLGFYMSSEFVYKGTKANIYNINLGRTGHGKKHIMECIEGLMRELGMDKYMGGAGATSDTAILEKLQETDGKCCYLIDEFAGFMKVLSNKKSGNSREAGLTAVLLKAYTNRVITGVDYADRKERKTVVVKNPYLSLLAFCTPEPFYEAVGSAEAFNGLVGRLTIFEGTNELPMRNKDYDDQADLNIPPEIIRILKDIQHNRTRADRDDGGWVYAQVTRVEESSEAVELIEQINDDIDAKRRQYDREHSQMGNVIARIFEITKKYALISSRGKPITVADITWAKAVADYNVGIMLGAAQNITDSGFERKKQHVYEFILKRGGFISKTDFTNNCKIFDNRRERDDVMVDLIESGRIEVVKIDSFGTKPKTGYQTIKK